MKNMVKFRNTGPVLSIIALTISIVPLLAVGQYSRPQLDDYTFSAFSFYTQQERDYSLYYTERSVRYAVQHGSSVDVIKAVYHSVADIYNQWQGTFSAIAVFALQPSVLFGENFYPLTLLFTIGMLMLSTTLFLKIVLRKNWVIPTVIVLFLTIHWLPNMASAFFWWNGATYYTMFYSLMLLSLAAKISILRNLNNKNFTIKVVLIAIFDFIIGGGNFVTALLNAEINASIVIMVITGFMMKLKLQKTAASVKFSTLAFFTASLSGLLVSAFAPGNIVRQNMHIKASVLKAVSDSICCAVTDISHWTTFVVVATSIVFLPLMWRLAKIVKFDFKYPLLITIASFLLFASQYTPPIYALSYAGELKLLNIIYYTYVWLIFGNLFYIIGWFQRRFELRSITNNSYKRIFDAGSVLFLVIALMLNYDTASFFICVNDLSEGLPQKFLLEYNQRLVILMDDTINAPILEPYTVRPQSLLPWSDPKSKTEMTDLATENTFWVNKAVAAYYGKEYVNCLPAKIVFARPDNSAVIVNGNLTTLPCYLIEATRYCKLRDLAFILGNAFDVTYVDGKNEVATGVNYNSVGGELRAVGTTLESACLIETKLNVNGLPSDVANYSICDEPYFKLRDLAGTIGFKMDWRDNKIYLSTLSS